MFLCGTEHFWTLAHNTTHETSSQYSQKLSLITTCIFPCMVTRISCTSQCTTSRQKNSTGTFVAKYIVYLRFPDKFHEVHRIDSHKRKWSRNRRMRPLALRASRRSGGSFADRIQHISPYDLRHWVHKYCRWEKAIRVLIDCNVSPQLVWNQSIRSIRSNEYTSALTGYT